MDGTSSSSTLPRQPYVGPGLPQNFSPFFSIRCYTHPVFYAQNSDVLPYTFFPGTCNTYANMINSFRIVIVKAKVLCSMGDIDMDGRIILIWILDN
jgi:hypothetical protein